MKQKRIRFLVLLAMLVFVTGLMVVANSPTGRALLKTKRHFVPVDQCPGLYFEPGMETMAKAVQNGWSESIAVVEASQGSPFPKPVKVYLCASWSSFNAFTGAPAKGRARGATFGEAVYLSHEAGRLGDPKGVLIHELSHLHLKQHLGMSFTWRIPEWFLEGLAVSVSGSGAERITGEEAAEAIQNGQTLVLHTRGRGLNPRRARDHGLSHFMYYRQSAMFVGYLKAKDPERFERFLGDLIHGGNFTTAFKNRFGTSLKGAWLAFTKNLSSEP